MAKLRLGRYEVEEYALPRVCARCGAKAVASPQKTFSWHPPWVIVFIFLGLLIYVVLALVLTKRMTVPLPLCERHRNYWRNRAIFIYGGLIAVVLLGIGGVVAASILDEGGKNNAIGAVCFIVGGVFVLWLFPAAILSATGIRPNEITDRSITLVGLSEDFVDAVREERRGDEDEEDEDDRPRRRRSRRDEDEDERPRSKRRGADDEDDGGYYDPDRRRRRGRDEDEDDR
ncbi:MAG TPA: hypothetical protein VKA46_03515 [Gemmataceae bacterium]|nr:hypothetical protein [Gemmataceae bacterium]